MNEQQLIISGFNPLDIREYAGQSIDQLPEEFRGSVAMSNLKQDEEDKELAWLWVEDASINGICIRAFDNPEEGSGVSVHIPVLASFMDVCLAFAIMDTIAAIHPESEFYNGEGEEIEFDAKMFEDSILDRNDTIAMLLGLPEKSVTIPTMKGDWQMDIEEYRKALAGIPLDKQINQVYSDIIDYIWKQKEKK